MQTVLDLRNVQFPRHESNNYHIKIILYEGGWPMHILVESQENQQKWCCVVTNLNDHQPTGTSYNIHEHEIIPSLQCGLLALCQDGQATEYTTNCQVTLEEIETCSLQLVLTLKYFTTILATYNFTLKPYSIENEKLHYQPKTRLSEQPCIRLISMSETFPSFHIQWTLVHPCDPDYFILACDTTIIKLAKNGIYQAKMDGYFHSAASDNGLQIILDGFEFYSHSSHHDTNQSSISFTHLFVAAKDSKMSIQCIGTNSLAPGAKLTIMLMH